MRSEKFFIPTVFKWILLLFLALFISTITRHIIYSIIRYKVDERYFYIILGIVYIILSVVIITTKRITGDKNFLQFKPLKFRLIIKLYVIQTTFNVIIMFFVHKLNLKNTFIYFVNMFMGKESFNATTILHFEFIKDPFFIYYFICVTILTPICEELIFRGVIYNDLKELFNVKAALVCSAIMFGLYHINGMLSNVIIYVILGILFVYCNEKTRTTWASIIFHFLINFTSLIILKIVNIHFGILISFIYIITCMIILIMELIKYLRGVELKDLFT